MKLFIKLFIFFISLFAIIYGIWWLTKYEIIHAYSSGKEQCITIISDNLNDFQWVIAGEHYSVPDTNYVKVDISNRGLATGFYVCFEDERYDWVALNNKTRILDCKLDTTRFSFTTSYTTEDYEIPDKLTGKGCCSFDVRVRTTDIPLLLNGDCIAKKR